ncbi:hypothetical protein QCN29_25340 [Streptomyces sp. HNM0663]|uniref:Uncharacterized protein n=1 Tax=Streptomyces chengmaiensis TaxID=3040919 RepID=A0ABT6HTK8_9ACTN|nr:hypothetical protein [Streptomyces chengmaiensis]MDH2392046.1 hypothetical protein [Streptomyces chengmaiensis]
MGETRFPDDGRRNPGGAQQDVLAAVRAMGYDPEAVAWRNRNAWKIVLVAVCLAAAVCVAVVVGVFAVVALLLLGR